jgi:hypothetical protein
MERWMEGGAWTNTGPCSAGHNVSVEICNSEQTCLCCQLLYECAYILFQRHVCMVSVCSLHTFTHLTGILLLSVCWHCACCWLCAMMAVAEFYGDVNSCLLATVYPLAAALNYKNNLLSVCVRIYVCLRVWCPCAFVYGDFYKQARWVFDAILISTN